MKDAKDDASRIHEFTTKLVSKPVRELKRGKSAKVGIKLFRVSAF